MYVFTFLYMYVCIYISPLENPSRTVAQAKVCVQQIGPYGWGIEFGCRVLEHVWLGFRFRLEVDPGWHGLHLEL